MAMADRWNRREALGGLAGTLLATLGTGVRAAGGFPMIWAFESLLTELRLFKFEWSSLGKKQSILGGGYPMWFSAGEPNEVPFMSGELEGVPDGMPEWIDLGWRSPVDRVRVGPRPDDFRDDYTRAKEYEQRVYPRATVPPSVVDDVRRSQDKALRLRFIFDDSMAKLDYDVYQIQR